MQNPANSSPNESTSSSSPQISDVQDRVLRVAARLFAERGYHAVSIRDIASECHVSVSTVLYGVRTKRQLLEAICGRSFASGTPWSAILTELDPAKCTDRESFLNAYDIFVSVLVQHAVNTPEARRLWLRLLLDQPELFEAFEEKYTLPLVRHGFALMCAARDAGLLDATDSQLRHILGGIDWIINGFFAGGIFDFNGKRIGLSNPEAAGELVAFLQDYARLWIPEKN